MKKREEERLLAGKGGLAEALPEFSPSEGVHYAEQNHCFARTMDEGRAFIKNVFQQPTDMIANYNEGRSDRQADDTKQFIPFCEDSKRGCHISRVPCRSCSAYLFQAPGCSSFLMCLYDLGYNRIELFRRNIADLFCR